jgi:hypothetical protein
MIGGFAALLAVWLPSLFNDSGKTILAWPWFAPLGAGITVVVALLLNSFFRPHGSTAEPPDGSAQSGLDAAR